ncbi:zinc ribbon domain-containing protein [Streptomyces kunmingensis]|uniref:Zinc ribbon domain-containing protein n=2 Tax=Streptomyces kunmingensis TaxID=68225 RepID=A0ABU6C8C4_9ACTN|nr:zinc ribbon domain-containing protein [Streptomyces kunmingensis]MEB3960968.1 zinc ribbon domain-containing protein [Streptomyces kunmingensis]
MAPAAEADAGFVYQRCRWCGTSSFRRLLCPVCASSDLKTEHSTGPGIVVQSRVVNRGTGVARNESMVRFPEDFVVPCRIVGTAPHMVWVGAAVRPARGAHNDSGEVVFELCDPAGDDDLR